MATSQDLNKAIENVQKEIRDRVEKDPKVGLKDFLVGEMKTLGMDVDGIENYDEAVGLLKKMPTDKKRILAKDYKEYEKKYNEAVEEMKRGMFNRVRDLPKVLLDIATKGAGLGMAVSTTINHYFPQAFTVIATALTASNQEMNALQKGLAYIGLASKVVAEVQPELVLGVGAVVGAAIYTAGKLVKGALKGRKNKKNEEKNDKER